MAVTDEVQALFGAPLDEAPGVLHVSSVWRDAAGGLRSLRIGPASPRSASDLFCLRLARARCEVLVTTGRILRAEPDVEQRLPEALLRWRREVRGLDEPPASVVLTRRADLDLAHPLLRSAARGIVLTGRDSAPSLAARVREAGLDTRLEVVGRDSPGLRDAVHFLRAERGHASICIEAGPSSVHTLYDEPLLVDELMLSVYEGEELHPLARGEAFVSERRLETRFEERHRCRRQEASGPWCFRRLVASGPARAR